MRAHTELTVTDTTTTTYVLHVAESDLHLLAADWAASGATDGTKTATIRNDTQNVALTAALTVSGVSAKARTPFVLASTNAKINKGDVITLVYTVTSAGSVVPGEVNIGLRLQEPVGQNFGPAWAG